MEQRTQQESFEEFARALAEAAERFPALSERFDVLVTRSESAAGPEAMEATRGRCNPPCSDKQRCVFNPLSGRWYCFPS